jgi:2-desacetyl-2-hydroxyethyl bacteriochlorophyllide A dehydrogenase
VKAQAVIYAEPNVVKFGDVEVADPAEGDAVVRTLVTVVSTGTDTRVLRGSPEAANYPTVPGYSSVGVVERVVGDGAAVKEGDLVFAGSPKGLVGIGQTWGAQVGVCVKPAASLVPLDDRRSPAEYGFSKVAGIALHGVRRSRSMPADPVVVVGQGLIGQLHARIQAARGCQVVVSDLHPWRLERAEAGGVMRTVNAREEDVVEVVKGLWPDGVPAAVEASSRQEGVDTCVEMIRGRPWNSDVDNRLSVLMLQASYLMRLEFDDMPLFHKEYTIVNARDTDPRDLVGAAQMIRSGSLKVDDLITLRARPQDAAEAFGELLAHPEQHLTIVFAWE